MLPTIKDVKFPKYDEAQSADARLELNHDKPESGNKKGRKKQGLQENADDYIRETFSLQSLIIYLEHYIEDHLPAKENNNSLPSQSVEQPDDFRNWFDPTHQNTNTSEHKRAAKAYAQTVQAAQKNLHYRKETRQPSEEVEIKYSLNDIYRLLWDLRTLNEKGIKHLEISTKESFIPAIENAVKATGSFL